MVGYLCTPCVSNNVPSLRHFISLNIEKHILHYFQQISFTLTRCEWSIKITPELLIKQTLHYILVKVKMICAGNTYRKGPIWWVRKGMGSEENVFIHSVDIIEKRHVFVVKYWWLKLLTSNSQNQTDIKDGRTNEGGTSSFWVHLRCRRMKMWHGNISQFTSLYLHLEKFFMYND